MALTIWDHCPTQSLTKMLNAILDIDEFHLSMDRRGIMNSENLCGVVKDELLHTEKLLSREGKRGKKHILR